MSTNNEVVAAAREVVKYWCDWPQSRRDAVGQLSSFLANAIDELVVAVSATPTRGECATCGRILTLTKDGNLRHHNGDVRVDGWRQVCDGSGQPARVAP